MVLYNVYGITHHLVLLLVLLSDDLQRLYPLGRTQCNTSRDCEFPKGLCLAPTDYTDWLASFRFAATYICFDQGIRVEGNWKALF